MATENSIYNVPVWESGKSYTKDDVVMRITYLDGTTTPPTNAVPKEVKYYYALRSTSGSTAPENTASIDNWGGYTTIGTQERPNFLWTPSYNVSTKHNPRVNVVKFGNGYEQRNPDGLFSSLIQMDLTFDKRSEKETSAILHFLKAQKGVKSFVFHNLPDLYADPASNDSFHKRFVCATFNSTFVFFNNYTVTAAFSQENN
jgi:phage-related protein